MADEKKRITALTEKSALDSGDYVAIDNSTGGTKKYQLNKLASSVTVDSSLSTSSTNPVQNAVITNNLPASASTSGSTVSFKNSSGSTLFTATISGGGGSVTVDSALSTSSENPVQNKVITNALPASASISSGVISFKNSSGTSLFTVTLPIYNGGIG